MTLTSYEIAAGHLAIWVDGEEQMLGPGESAIV